MSNAIKAVFVLVFFLLFQGCSGGFNNVESENPGAEQLHKERIKRNMDAVMIARGNYLLEIRPYEESLVQAGEGDFFAESRYNSYRNEVKEVSEKLYEIGRNAFEKKQYRLALEAISVSNRLYPNPPARGLLVEIWKQKQAELEQLRDIEAAEEKKHWAAMVDGFRRFMEVGDLLGAKRIAAEMKKVDPEKTANYVEQLDKRIKSEVEAQLSHGQLLYAQGHLQEAINVWQEALELKPDNEELKQNISRARTFLENMNKWGK